MYIYIYTGSCVLCELLHWENNCCFILLKATILNANRAGISKAP